MKEKATPADQALAETIEDFFFHDYEEERADLLNAIELAKKILDRFEVKERK